MIIHYNIDLKLFEAQFVNESKNPDILKFTLLHKLERNDKTLHLSQNFSPIWQDVMANYEPNHFSKFFLIIGRQAGFTDSRIIYMWVRSQGMFTGSTFTVYKDLEDIDFETMDEELIRTYLVNLSQKQSTDLEYSQEPRIGTK